MAWQQHGIEVVSPKSKLLEREVWTVWLHFKKFYGPRLRTGTFPTLNFCDYSGSKIGKKYISLFSTFHLGDIWNVCNIANRNKKSKQYPELYRTRETM